MSYALCFVSSRRFSELSRSFTQINFTTDVYNLRCSSFNRSRWARNLVFFARIIWKHLAWSRLKSSPYLRVSTLSEDNRLTRFRTAWDDVRPATLTNLLLKSGPPPAPPPTFIISSSSSISMSNWFTWPYWHTFWPFTLFQSRDGQLSTPHTWPRTYLTIFYFCCESKSWLLLLGRAPETVKQTWKTVKLKINVKINVRIEKNRKK